MSNYQPMNRSEIAFLVAQHFEDGAVVNLGIGMPTQVSNFLPPDKEILLHSENGILGMGRPAVGEEIDGDLINASRTPIVLVPGASICEHTTSFAMMRGGHLDYSVLGGFQVAVNGDLANWMTIGPDAIAAIGGAMDLAVGAKSVIVMMDHVAKDGSPKLLKTCTYPLTGIGVVKHVYTDLAIIDVKNGEFIVRAMPEGLDFEELQAKTGAPLKRADNFSIIKRDQAGKLSF
jgi:3-oxoadipate CoA-transferase beta subunit